MAHLKLRHVPPAADDVSSQMSPFRTADTEGYRDKLHGTPQGLQHTLHSAIRGWLCRGPFWGGEARVADAAAACPSSGTNGGAYPPRARARVPPRAVGGSSSTRDLSAEEQWAERVAGTCT